MGVFVAGASGAIGAQLMPNLVAPGHQVVAVTQGGVEATQGGVEARWVAGLGARPVVADALSIPPPWLAWSAKPSLR